MFKLNPFKKSFALDLSDNVMRVIQLSYSKKSNSIISFNELPIPSGLMFDGEIKEKNKLIKLIKKLIKQAEGKKISTSFVKCVLPERKTFIKLIKIPKTKKENLKEAIKWEATQHIPMRLEEIYLSYQIINTDPPDNKKSVLIAATPRIIADSYYELLVSTDLTPLSLEPESVAITRCVTPFSQKVKNPVLIIDFGGSHTDLVIYDKKAIQFSSSINFSSSTLTKKLSKKLKIDLNDAEKAKKLYGLEKTKGKGKIRKILEPALSPMIDKILETQDFYNNHFPDSDKFKHIILSGGGAELKHLDTFLADKTNIKVSRANPLAHINPPKKNSFAPQKAPSFTTVIGLALK